MKDIGINKDIPQLRTDISLEEHKQIARKRRPESQRMFNKTKKMWNEFLAAYPEAKDWVAYDPFK